MSTHDKHQIRNGLIVTVIGGVVVGLVLRLVPAAWPWLVTAFLRLMDILGTRVSIPIWLLALILIPAAIVVALVIMALLPRRCVPAWFEYKSDTFDGIIWRWHYGADGRILDPRAYCPNDDTFLVYSTLLGSTTLTCETCNRSYGPFSGELTYVIGRVERQIERRVRTREWSQKNDHAA